VQVDARVGSKLLVLLLCIVIAVAFKLLIPFTSVYLHTIQPIPPMLVTTQFGLVDILAPDQKWLEPQQSTASTSSAPIVCVDREALEIIVEQWMYASSRSSDPPTSISELRQRLSDQTGARDEFARKMRAMIADIDSSFTDADDVQLSPVPEHVRALL